MKILSSYKNEELQPRLDKGLDIYGFPDRYYNIARALINLNPNSQELIDRHGKDLKIHEVVNLADKYIKIEVMNIYRRRRIS